MVDRLGQRGSQEWELLDAVCAKPQRLSLAEVYSAWCASKLPSLRARLNDQDLEPLVDRWLLSRANELAPDTLSHYRVHVRHFIPAGVPFYRSKFTTAVVRAGLDALDKSAGTKRKYRAALLAFVSYLEQCDVLTENPVSRAKVSGRIVVRDSFIDRTTLYKVLLATPEPYRSVAAILHATGADVSQVLRVSVNDVELSTQQLQLRDGKTMYRNRSVLVQEWAWQYVLEWLARAKQHGTDGNALLFPSVNRWTLSDRFREACAMVGVSNYWLRDSRHSYAVEILKAGGTPAAVARQLGHSNTVLVHRVYGRYLAPDAEVQDAHRKVARQNRDGRGTRNSLRGSA